MKAVMVSFFSGKPHLGTDDFIKWVQDGRLVHVAFHLSEEEVVNANFSDGVVIKDPMILGYDGVLTLSKNFEDDVADKMMAAARDCLGKPYNLSKLAFIATRKYIPAIGKYEAKLVWKKGLICSDTVNKPLQAANEGVADLCISVEKLFFHMLQNKWYPYSTTGDIARAEDAIVGYQENLVPC